MSLVFLYNISIIIYIKAVVICLKVYYIIKIKFSGRSSGVEHNLAKVGVEGSNPFARSNQIMKNYLILLFPFLLIAITSCTNKVAYQSYELPQVSKKDEKEEIFLQKKILIYEMISASKVLHQISWPILKKNIDICNNEGPYSLGALFAAEQDLPKIDSKYFKLLLNKNIKPFYLKKYRVESFPVVVSVAKDSPAYKSNLLEKDIILEINKKKVSSFRKKLKKSLESSSVVNLTILRNNKVINKQIQGIKACNYNVQAIPAASPNAYADGEKVFITLAAIKLARTEDELAFLIGHELAHNIYHYNYKKGTEANSLAINYLDMPKLKDLNSFFLFSTQSKETEADLKGVEIAFKAGYALENVNDYWRRLSVFNPSLISSSSSVYKSNALRAIMISKTVKRLKDLNESK